MTEAGTTIVRRSRALPFLTIGALVAAPTLPANSQGQTTLCNSPIHGVIAPPTSIKRSVAMTSQECQPVDLRDLRGGGQDCP